MLNVSPETQLLIYDLNLARNDPQGYAQDNGLNVDLSDITPRAPLAINNALSNAALFRVGRVLAHYEPNDLSSLIMALECHQRTEAPSS